VRSRPERPVARRASRRIPAAAIVALLTFAAASPAPAQNSGSVVDAAATSEQIRRALDTVKADPNVTAQRTVRTLRWRNTQQARPPARAGWLVQLMAWLQQSSRALMWVAAIIVSLLLAVYLFGALRRRDDGEGVETSVLLPSHVRALDIRPSSLPADVGAAARALWMRGEQRAAMSLLYRGMLSRLVHVHRVPITDSSTEGECLRLAAGALPPASGLYVSGLVGEWQRLVYGHHPPDDERVQALCEAFDVSLARPRPEAVPLEVPGAAAAGGVA
jgi:hypothetical protein